MIHHRECRDCKSLLIFSSCPSSLNTSVGKACEPPSLFEENTRVFSPNRRTVKIQTCEHGDKKYRHQNTNGDIDTKFRKNIRIFTGTSTRTNEI